MEQLFPEQWPVTQAVTGLGAANWGLVEFADTNLLTDTLEMSGDVLMATMALIGVAGVLALYNVAAHFLGD